MGTDDATNETTGLTILVTGATSGIGRAAAVRLAGEAPEGSSLFLVARDPDRGKATVDEIRRNGGHDRVDVLIADLSELAQVRALADQVRERTDRLDVLINNAGLVMGDRRLTSDGHEWTLAVNHLAPFLLTHLVLDLLRSSPAPRVVTTSSVAMNWGSIDMDDLMWTRRRYTQFRAYGASKLANALFAAESARRWPEVWSVSAHPGAVNTGFGSDGSWWLRNAIRMFGSLVLRTPEQGAQVLVWSALSSAAAPPAVPSGSFVVDDKVSRPSRDARDKVLATELWEESLRLTGLA